MMGFRQALNLSNALKHRAMDNLRSPLVVTAEDLQTQPVDIELEAFRSEIPINPEVYGKWYKPLTQDTLNEAGSVPMLESDFDYAGIILSNGRILSDGVTHVSVFDSRNQLQEDYTAKHRIKPATKLKRKPKTRITGTTLHLCAPIATVRGNYAHWLLDGLARWVLLEDRCTNDSVSIDQFLIPPNKPALRESLHVLGVSDKRIVELSIHEAMEFEQLVCVSRPRGYSSNVAPGWLVNGYRARLAPAMAAEQTASKRLYISRRDAGARKFRQEDVLVEALEQRGFQSVELSKLGFQEKAELFSQATDVVGLTGAGLMCVMFCPPSARVVEIYPSNFVTYLYASISAALGHRHHAYIFKNNSKKSLLSRHSGEFDLDLTDFLATLDSWQKPQV